MDSLVVRLTILPVGGSQEAFTPGESCHTKKSLLSDEESRLEKARFVFQLEAEPDTESNVTDTLIRRRLPVITSMRIRSSS